MYNCKTVKNITQNAPKLNILRAKVKKFSGEGAQWTTHPLGAFGASIGTDQEVNVRIGKAPGVFSKLGKLWKSKKISLPVKTRLQPLHVTVDQ